MDLFDQIDSVKIVRQIELKDAQLKYYPEFLSKEEGKAVYDALIRDLSWEQETITMYGRQMPIPRLSAWYGDEGVAYTYSGIRSVAKPWVSGLLNIKQKVEDITQHNFNSVLANFYRNGQDSVSWHADDEPELGPNPVIASLSLGEVRSFQLKHRHQQNEKYQLDLANGSLLVMGEGTQENWLHQVPKTRRKIEPRINLTFRFVYT